jgi:hypothetical protein
MNITNPATFDLGAGGVVPLTVEHLCLLICITKDLMQLLNFMGALPFKLIDKVYSVFEHTLFLCELSVELGIKLLHLLFLLH